METEDRKKKSENQSAKMRTLPEQVRYDWERGLTIIQLADKHNLPESTVRAHLGLRP